MSESSGEFIRFVVSLVESGATQIHQTAVDVANPWSERYGKYLSRAELRALSAPDPEAMKRCKDWFRSCKIPVYDGLFEVDAPQIFAAFAKREVVEKAFPGWETVGRQITHGEWHLPGDIAGFVKQMSVSHVKFEGKGPKMSKAHPVKKPRWAWNGTEPLTGPAPDSPGSTGGMTPADIARIYGFPEEWDGTGETIVLLATSAPSLADVVAFWEMHGIRRQPPEVVDFPGKRFTGSTQSDLATLEITTNVQWLGAMAPGAKIIVLNVDTSWASDPWSATLGWALAEKEPTIVVTTYTMPAGSYYESFGRRNFTDLLDAAAAVGVTVVSASGDWGVYDGRPSTNFNGLQVCHAAWPSAIFPASQPGVLAVGGTMITHTHPLTEVGWSGLPPPDPRLQRVLGMTRLGSTGGFTEMFPMPDWQKDAIRSRKMYSRGTNMPSVSPYGRGYPDVALMAQGATVQAPDGTLVGLGYQARFQGQDIDYAGGTSVAAPIWGAIIARWNQARVAEGLPRVGAVGPLLYHLAGEDAQVFRDINSGHSDVEMQIVNSDNDVASFRISGYQSCNGWDPVAGLGVPRVTELINSSVGKMRRGAPAPAKKTRARPAVKKA